MQGKYAGGKSADGNRFGPLDVKAVLYSHSHVDHFGGAEGAIDRNDVADPSLSIDKQLASGKTVILAPEGFLKHAISENVYAGIAMARRAQYQYGTVLEKERKEHSPSASAWDSLPVR